MRRLQEETIRVVKLPDVRERLEGLGITPVGAASDEFSRIVASDLARYTAVAKAANVKAD